MLTKVMEIEMMEMMEIGIEKVEHFGGQLPENHACISDIWNLFSATYQFHRHERCGNMGDF